MISAAAARGATAAAGESGNRTEEWGRLSGRCCAAGAHVLLSRSRGTSSRRASSRKQAVQRRWACRRGLQRERNAQRHSQAVGGLGRRNGVRRSKQLPACAADEQRLTSAVFASLHHHAPGVVEVFDSHALALRVQQQQVFHQRQESVLQVRHERRATARTGRRPQRMPRRTACSASVEFAKALTLAATVSNACKLV